MQAGFCCMESGLSRSKNSINVAIKGVVDICVVGALFWLCGYGLMFGESLYGVVGTSRFFFEETSTSHTLTVFFIFQLVSCGTAMTIASGAVAERMKFYGYLAMTFVIGGVIYPVFGHWVWAGLPGNEPHGWLGRLGFLDFAGSTVVHSVGAWAALAAVILIGARQGRFEPGKPPRKFHGHNLPMAALGLFILWFGWFGFTGGRSFGVNQTLPIILINTMLAGIFGGLGGMIWGKTFENRISVETVMSGVLAGLVAICASCNLVSTPAAAIIGFLAALIMRGSQYLLEHRWRIDDGVGVIPAHGFAGVWGTLAVAIYAPESAFAEGVTRYEQFGIQLLGALVAFAWSFGLCWGSLSFIRRFIDLRVTAEEEEMGLNVVEHGASTELHDLVLTMIENANGDTSRRAAADPYTDAGVIAGQYNRVLDANDDARDQLVSYASEL